jgi:hypothetical protein
VILLLTARWQASAHARCPGCAALARWGSRLLFRPRRLRLDSLALSLAAVLGATVSWHTPRDRMREALKLGTLRTAGPTGR